MDAALAWVKGVHITALALWCAGLFYLPGLFVSHGRPQGAHAFHRLRVLTRYCYVVIVSPAAVLAILSGSALIGLGRGEGGWLPVKLTAVTGMVLFHVLCGYLLALLREQPERYPPRMLWVLLAVPAVLVPLVLWLVLAKPL